MQFPLIPFTREDLRRALGEPSFREGRNFLDLGKVLHVGFKTPVEIHGEVSGRGSGVYSVSVHLMFGPDDILALIEGHCSCPEAFNCKHVAALLLAAEDRLGQEAAARDPTDLSRLPGEVRNWLGRWPGTTGASLDVRPPGPPAPSREHLFYVIHRDPTRGMCVSPYRAYLKKDGTIGTNFRRYDRRSAWNRKNLTVQDAGLIGKLDFFADGDYEPRFDWPEGDVAVDLVHEIVETGRARADEIRGMPLTWAPARFCEPVWEIRGAGEQHLAIRDGGGSALTLLPFPTPLFFDPATGETGVAETALPPRTLCWFADAPAVPPRAAHAVASKLSGIGRHAPRMHPVEERTDVRPEPILSLYGCERAATLYGPHASRRAASGMPSTVYPCARLEVAYEGVKTTLRPGGGGDIPVPGDGGLFAFAGRDHEREAEFRRTLSEAGRRHGGKHPDALRTGIAPPREVFGKRCADPISGSGLTTTGIS